jgi:uncharacterized protein (TIGR02118 family)
MIKLTFALRRREGMSLEDFQAYWHEQHGPLVARHADVLRIRRYVQGHRRETPLDAALAESREIEVEPYDGTAELWWDSVEDIAAVLETEEGQAAAAALLEDERRFIDLPRSSLWLGEEHVVVA